MNRTLKTIISTALVGTIAVTSAVCSFAKYKGDLDGDDKVTSNDALKVLMHVVGIEKDELDMTVADLDGDGKLTSSDALEILRTCVGQVDPVEITEEEDPVEPEQPSLSTKQEIVDYYKKALADTYASSKVTADKTETVSITLDTLSPSAAKSLADNLIKSNSQPKNNKETFNSDAKSAQKFLVPNSLEADGVVTATAKESNGGYEISITLVKESVDTSTMPKYNSQASLPLNISSLGLSSLTINSGGFEYPGTIITAKTDKNGKLISMKHEMPLSFSAKGKLSVFNVSATGHGTYTLDVAFTY